MYILHIPSWFPNDLMPYSGNFIEKHIHAVSQTIKCVTLRVTRNSIKKNKSDCALFSKQKGELKDDKNILIEYVIKNRTSFLGKMWMKTCELYFYRKGMLHIKKKYGKPELIHLHVALPMGIFAVKWSKRWQTPLVLSEHWSIYNQLNRKLLTPSQKRKLSIIFEALSGVTTVSHNLLECIQELFPVRKCAVIYNVVNTSLFVPAKPNYPPLTILHVSTLVERAKNFLGILDGIKLLSAKRADFLLEVICEFKNAKAEEYVKENHLEKYVKFIGSLPEEQVALKMGACNFLLLFSNYENLPCVIIEALSCGKPVVVTPVGGIPEIVNEERGVFVEPKNVKQLAEKLDFMLNNFTTFDGKLARSFAVENFSQEVICRNFKAFYEEILYPQVFPS